MSCPEIRLHAARRDGLPERARRLARIARASLTRRRHGVSVGAGGIATLLMLAAGAATAAPATERLEITTASGPHPFVVEVMRNRPDLEKGLMFRREMAPDHGMLFDFGQSQNVLMWMKNTYLPLDMVFIDKAGKVINVAHDAVPMTETTIPSGGPVLGVLEINAGIANKIGLRDGDTVKASIFHKP